MTKYACDLCKSDLPEKMQPLKIRIGSNMHDFCNKCHTTLLEMLDGTGTGVVENNMSELMEAFGKAGKTNQGIVLYPNAPTYVPNTGGNWGLNVDGMEGIVGTTVTYTTGTSPTGTMQNAGPYTETVQSSGFITQANNNVSLSGLSDPKSNGIFAAFTQDAIYDSLKDMMSITSISKRPSLPAGLFPMKGV